VATAGTVLITVGVLAALGGGFWLLASALVPEGDRLVLAFEVVLLVLLGGVVAYVLGQVGGRMSERQAGRQAAEELRLRREREAAELAARQAERAQIAAREADAVRRLGSSQGGVSGPPAGD